jgi:hypothetical protein
MQKVPLSYVHPATIKVVGEKDEKEGKVVGGKR